MANTSKGVAGVPAESARPADSSSASSRTPPPKMVAAEATKAPPPKAPTTAEPSTPAVVVPRAMMTDPFAGASFNLKGKGSDPSPVFVDVEVFAESRRTALGAKDLSKTIAPDGCMFSAGFSPKRKLQLTAHLDKDTAWRNKRANGFIGHIQRLSTSHNAERPVMVQTDCEDSFHDVS